MSLKHSDIAQIIKLIDESTLDEVSIEVGDVKIEVRRRGAGEALPVATPPPAAAAVEVTPTAETAPPADETPIRPSTDDDAVLATVTRTDGADGLIEVRSPMVGTFYRRPSPEAAPYADVGTEVTPGDPLCLVEVMKLFTTLHAEVSGKVVEICVEDAELVEHDQVLFRMEPV